MNMDLVASYDSEIGDDSDIEEIKKTSKVDVIDLESGSDDETTTQSDNSKLHSENEKNSNAHSAIEKSCLRGKSSDLSLGTTKNIPEEISSITSDLTKTKKADYLHLETSDSEEEVQQLGEKHSLLKSASILNEIPSGPVKPAELSSESLKRSGQNSCNSEKDILSSNSFCEDIDSGINSESKKLKSDSLLGLHDVEKCKVDKVPCLFKEDEEVIVATQKNIVCRIPRQIIQTHKAHSRAIMSLNWCIPQFSHLFLSASLDGTLKIWDLGHKNPVQYIDVNAGLSAAKWSLDGAQIITGGFGKKAYVFDVQTGKGIVEYDIYNYVTSMEVHPYMDDVFLVGTRNAILGFDIRVNTTFPIRSYFSNCKEVLDIAFLDENEFVCSTNIVSHDSADRTIMVWNFASGCVLSNQIYLERFTCPSLKVHPTDSYFVAQTHGNYIACFSTIKPYKMQNKRYMGHKVGAYGIECDISPDGKYLASGDADDGVYFYNYGSTALVIKHPIKPAGSLNPKDAEKEKPNPTNRLKWHPVFPSMMITSSYDGTIQIWK